MKYLFLFILCINSVYGQLNKVVFGNFILNNKVYQYKCEKDHGIYKFSVSSMEPKQLFTNVTAKDIDKILINLNQLLDTNDVNEKKLFSELSKHYQEVKYIIENKSIWAESEKNIDSVIDTLVARKKNLLRTDTLQILRILREYRVFLLRNKEINKSRVKLTEGLDVDIFRLLFKEAIAEILDKNETIKKENLQVADEIFYSIKARMDFIDDEPTTAYLILKRKYLDIAFQTQKSVNLNRKQKRRLKRHILDSLTIINSKSLEGKERKKKYERKEIRSELEVLSQNMVDTMIYNTSVVKEVIRCEIKKVSVEFDEGTIKNLLIDVLPDNEEYLRIYGSTTIRFRNNMPISISTKFDPDKFNDQNIFVSNSKELLEVLKTKKAKFEIKWSDCDNVLAP